MPAAAVAAAVLAAGGLFLAAVPPWNLPDEPTHLDRVRRLAGTPVSQAAVIRSMAGYGFWRNLGLETPCPLPSRFEEIEFLRLAGAADQTEKRPAAYYLAAAALLRTAGAASPVADLYLLRGFSLLLTSLTGALLCLAARRLAPGEPWFGLGAAAAGVLLPQALLIGVSASYEPLLDAAAAAFLLAAVRMQFAGPTFLSVAALTLTAAAAAAVSPKGLFLLPAAPLAGILAGAGVEGPGRRLRGLAGGAGTLLAAAAVALALTWFRPEAAAKLLAAVREAWEKLRETCGGGVYPAWRYYPWFNREVFRSFFFKAGWAAALLPAWTYAVFAGACLLALAGQVPLLIRLAARRRESRGACLRAWAVLAAVAAFSVLGFYLSRGLGPRAAPQGRHLLVGAGAGGILFAWGLTAWARRRWRTAIAVGVFLAFFLSDLAIAAFFLFPLYGS